MNWKLTDKDNPHPKTQRSPSVRPALHRAFEEGGERQAKKLVEYIGENSDIETHNRVWWQELRCQVGLT